MSVQLRTALEMHRNFYKNKLLTLDTYDLTTIAQMTFTELQEEYHYFFNAEEEEKKVKLS